MPSHLTTIGFPVESAEEFVALAEEFAPATQQVKTGRGRYLQWRSGCGAELWLQVNLDRELVGMTPHFGGKSILRVGLTERIARPDDTELDGAFHGWTDPEGPDPESGTYPFVFDCPDAACSDGLALPAQVDVQIAAFAHELAVYESVEAYDREEGEGPKLAAESFIPSGLFVPEDGPEGPPKALAIITGVVEETEQRTNPTTDRSFWWARVRSLGGMFDIVADPELVAEAPTVGGVLSGSFWLSGRLCGRPTTSGGRFLRRLFGRG